MVDDQFLEASSDDQLMLTLPANIIAQIDALTGSEFMDREDFVRAAVRHYLDYLRQAQKAAEETNIG